MIAVRVSIALEGPGRLRWSANGQEDAGKFLNAVQSVLDSSATTLPVMNSLCDRSGGVLEQPNSCNARHASDDWRNDGWPRRSCGPQLVGTQVTVNSMLLQESCPLACWMLMHSSHVATHEAIGIEPLTLFSRLDRTLYEMRDGVVVFSRRATVEVPQELSLTGLQDSREYRLIALAFHRGQSIKRRHWVVWRPGQLVGEVVPFAIDDDHIRRHPYAHIAR